MMLQLMLAILATMGLVDGDVFNNRASVIYGGSVNSANATSIINEAKSNGLLIGGASLKPEEFCKIISYNS